MQVPNLPGTDSLYKFAAIAGAIGVLTLGGGQIEYLARLDSDISRLSIEGVVLRADAEKLRAESALQIKEVESLIAADERDIKSAEQLQAHLQDDLDHSDGSHRTALRHSASDLMGKRLARIVPHHEKTRAMYAAYELRTTSEGERLKTRVKELEAKVERDSHLLTVDSGLLLPIVLAIAFCWNTSIWGFRRWYHFQKMQDALLVARFNAAQGSVPAPPRLIHEA